MEREEMVKKAEEWIAGATGLTGSALCNALADLLLAVLAEERAKHQPIMVQARPFTIEEDEPVTPEAAAAARSGA